ncbi:family 4 glycosyl hydrolase [Paradevosia shaoguanensis]|uniref:6-phospho-beta-glucosidase n=1 Tax=Paradevosia shaoguanensis TaxID=1335043 RepID=A0AA41UBM0_9HYPH|nr:6-phospho-beta-glucosidase [Paradevosia shaoguanensis]MCF1742819.1 6-phospho-beta-glucosidase [Paradevosia shaoguanensis]MCI0127302.1 6-phospho-beta-glucosidase [Paradevosia shaoguanensis]
MKLALIGGGGLRAPLFVESALRRGDRIGLTEICLMDIQPDQLALIGALSNELSRRAGGKVAITTTTDIEAAFDGADYAVTTVRPGGIEGRITDERIALGAGVLGQETTGAGGFAMALRSIPTILDYARILQRLSPKAWLFNFTNPAGLVTQALRNAGFERTIGICDSANGAQTAIAKWLKVSERAVDAEVFGLNHLSFTRRATVNGCDMLPDALADDAFLATTAQRVFAPHVVRRHGLWLNEYLYYFYYAEEAVAAISAGPTRGEEIRALNGKLIPQLRSIDVVAEPGRALDVYFAYERERSATYMHYANHTDGEDAPLVSTAADDDHDGEGYAGVALNLIEALSGGEPLRTGLNVPNRGAIAGLHDDDVVEVSCVVDANGVTPLPIGAMPEAQAYLVNSVKHYERLTVQAIAERRRDIAVEALVAHPLVLSYSRAEPLVDKFLAVHADYVGEWR